MYRQLDDVRCSGDPEEARASSDDEDQESDTVAEDNTAIAGYSLKN